MLKFQGCIVFLLSAMVFHATTRVFVTHSNDGINKTNKSKADINDFKRPIDGLIASTLNNNCFSMRLVSSISNGTISALNTDLVIKWDLIPPCWPC